MFRMNFSCKSIARELYNLNISINRLLNFKNMFNCSGMENENTFLKSTSGYLFANPDTAISSLKVCY